MSDTHHHDAIEDNLETHPVKLAIVVVAGAVALIVAIIMLVQFAIGAYGGRSLKDEPAMSAEAVAARIAPVAKFTVDPAAPAPAAAPAAGAAPVAVAAVSIPAAPAKAGGADAGKGKALYDTVCMACHASGVAGSPKFGDKAAWAPRIKTGTAALYEAALKGKGAMPAKGGSAAADADVKAAVDYMVAAGK
jgi:cytochrome c5